MNEISRQGDNRRLKWAALLCVAAALGLEARLFQLQILHHKQGGDVAGKITTKNFSLRADRGLIVDRNLRKMVSNAHFETLVAHPKEVRDAAALARTLAPILEVSAPTLESRLTAKREQRALRRRLPAEALYSLRALAPAANRDDPKIGESPRSPQGLEPLGVEGLALLREPTRNYLKGELAGQVLGFVDVDNVGRAGIEKIAEAKLQGTTVTLQARRYGDRRSILEADYTRTVPMRGADVVLTLDETIQWIAERALYSHCREREAKGGMAVVMNPGNGEILAMANYPAFDPAKVGEYDARGEMERARNRCLSDLFEPGSTMKPFIVAAGLECGAIAPDTVIDCENGIRHLPRIRPKPIRDEHPVGRVPVGDVLVHSSNIGAGKIAERIVNLDSEKPSYKRLFDRLSAFGLGDRTGLDLPGESPMVFRPSWREWTHSDLLVLAFGTGPVMVTAVGLARAYSALVNGGFRVQPHIIKGYVGNRDGRFYENKTEEKVRVLGEETSRVLRDMLVQVVERGHSKAKCDWYRVGGKTGTSKKVVNGQYSPDHRLLSFAGFAPREDPRVVVVVMMDEPQGVRFGNEAAAPVFRQIVEETLAYLHVPPNPEKALERLRAEEPKVALASGAGESAKRRTDQ